MQKITFTNVDKKVEKLAGIEKNSSEDIAKLFKRNNDLLSSIADLNKTVWRNLARENNLMQNQKNFRTELNFISKKLNKVGSFQLFEQ